MRDVSSFPSSPPRAEHAPRLSSPRAKVRRTGCNAVFINTLGVSVSVRFVNERTSEPKFLLLSVFKLKKSISRSRVSTATHTPPAKWPIA
ncbi:hypothetical protein PUN28_006384 [Cardiocondyla obscurior]|uniref:Uncharacterized protein n=1 Tax=Cardiocondyla obscurior TaxID=286306 RepID=A0AAW2GDP6_9HYME